MHELESGPSAVLTALDAKSYDHAIVLSYRQELSAEQADAHTMLMLLTLHKARSKGAAGTRVVAEMRDRANVLIARTIEVDDFIVSDELSSLMLAQVSERRELDAVFRELFDASGSVLALRPAARYAPADESGLGGDGGRGGRARRERDRLPRRQLGRRPQPGQDGGAEARRRGPRARARPSRAGHARRPSSGAVPR